MDPEVRRRSRRIRPVAIVVGLLIAAAGVVVALPDGDPAPVDVATLSRGHDPGPVPDPDPTTSSSTVTTSVPTTQHRATSTTTTTSPGPSWRPTTSTTIRATTTTTGPGADTSCRTTAAWPGPLPPPRKHIPGFEGHTSTGQTWVLSDEYDANVGDITKGGFYVLEADGSQLRHLTPSIGTFVWSPDGCWLANNQGGLSLFNPRRGDSIYLSGDLGMTFGTPAWSADSSRVAVILDPDHLTKGDSDLAVFPIEGSTPPAVIRLPGDQIDQAWLPDGRIVVLDGEGLWLVRPDGPIVRRIATGPLAAGRLLLSPTGEIAAVVQWGRDGVSDDRVVLIDLGGDQATPRPVCGEAGIVRSRKPAWSPTGERLACPIRIEGQVATILVPVGGGPGTLLDSDFDMPHWVNHRLVGVDHNGALVAIDANGTGRSVLRQPSQPAIRAPALSPSGNEIAFATG